MDTRIRSLIDALLKETRMLGIEISALVLFGSQSDGTATDGSDVDIALISSSFQNLDSLQRRKLVKPALYQIIERYKIPIDLTLFIQKNPSGVESLSKPILRDTNRG